MYIYIYLFYLFLNVLLTTKCKKKFIYGAYSTSLYHLKFKHTL